MTPVNDNRVAAISSQILRYLERHPGAQDTLEGIAQWWLLEQNIQTAVKDIQTALDELTARHLVNVRSAPDGRIYYSRNPSEGRGMGSTNRLSQIYGLLA